MKRKLLSVFILLSVFYNCFSQLNINGEQITILKEALANDGKDEKQIESIINGVLKNPDIYNKVWSYFLNKNDNKFKLLKDIDVKFKTFQNADSSRSSLGFSYNFSYDYSKFIKLQSGNRESISFGINAKGNIAFKKETNPNNFLETNLNCTYSKYIGGIIKKSNAQILTDKNAVELKLAALKDVHSQEALQLWEEFGRGLNFSNEYYYNISPEIGYESNQDFTKTQFTPAISISLGAKAWNDKNVLAKLNVLDYPFALLRLILKTDKDFTPYGSTIPTAQFGIAYVVPSKDSDREKILNSDKPYPRFKFETSFRTIISRIKSENIFFNADFRYYSELNSPDLIKRANFNSQTYFVMALQSTTGFYVSYSVGKLPIDLKSDKVYSIGFDYKF